MNVAEGKVPLFYFADFELQSSNGETQRPLYFRKSQIVVEEYKKRNRSSEPLPEVSVTELLSVLRERALRNKDLNFTCSIALTVG